MSKKRQKIRKTGAAFGTLVYTGDFQVESPHVSTIRFNEANFSEKKQFRDDSPCVVPDQITWLDVRGLSHVELIERIGQRLSISPLALEDIAHTEQRPKFEEYETGLFLIAQNLAFDEKLMTLQSEQIALFFAKNVVASFQEDPDDTFQNIRTRLSDPKSRIRKRGADYLANALLDTIVDNYYLVIDALETELESLESALFANPHSVAVRNRIFKTKQVAYQFRRKAHPLRDATLRFFKTENEIVEEQNRVFIRDVQDHLNQIIDSIDHQIETLDGFQELAQAEASNRLNNVMRLLTVISTIFIPLSFIAGVYGMNFDNMPELHSPNGYHYVLGVMFILLVAMLGFFRWKKWI